MEEEMSNSIRRMSTRSRKVAPKMAAALASSDNRTQAMLARLEALENDNAGMEMVQNDEDDEASLDEDDQVYQKKQSKSTKRKTRQAKALEDAKKAPRTFLELLNEANLESLPPHVPSYLRAAVGPPSSVARRHFCTCPSVPTQELRFSSLASYLLKEPDIFGTANKSSLNVDANAIQSWRVNKPRWCQQTRLLDLLI
ncbi:SWR1 complex subunit 6 [Abeliophyllum distichum]|uniref:SWR1 complex subunit 6 n=1 Tax=Abeliophyllum distichum TaxID=126358 RepID=A0ABD1VRV8_9LAMI